MTLFEEYLVLDRGKATLIHTSHSSFIYVFNYSYNKKAGLRFKKNDEYHYSIEVITLRPNHLFPDYKHIITFMSGFEIFYNFTRTTCKCASFKESCMKSTNKIWLLIFLSPRGRFCYKFEIRVSWPPKKLRTNVNYYMKERGHYYRCEIHPKETS